MGFEYSAAKAFHPDWAWETPAGFRDEFWVWPFVFTVPGNGTLAQGLPVQNDDDADFLMRAIWCPQLAITPAGLSGQYVTRNSGFLRLSTSDGRQTSTDLVLTAGSLCAGGFDGLQGFGGSLVDPLVIPARGVASLDVLLSTNARFAFVNQAFGGGSLLFAWNVYGTAGNGRTVQLLNPGAPSVALSAAVVGGNVEVTLGTNGGGAITSTLADVAAIINNTASVASVMLAQTGGDASELATATAALVLGGGLASSPISFSGAFIGYKRVAIC